MDRKVILERIIRNDRIDICDFIELPQYPQFKMQCFGFAGKALTATHTSTPSTKKSCPFLVILLKKSHLKPVFNVAIPLQRKRSCGLSNEVGIYSPRRSRFGGAQSV
jgi:hypothetical protein